MKWLRLLTLVGMAGLAFSQGIEKGDDGNEQGNGSGRLTKSVHETLPHAAQNAASLARARSSLIKYHNGPLLVNTSGVNVYYIWYGNWSGNSAVQILEDLARNIGPSSYFNINTTYFDRNNARVPNQVNLKGTTTDNYSQGTSLTDSKVQAVVSSAISSGRLPRDVNGIYFVLTSQDVNESSGFCTQYCGWHTYGSISGSNIKFAFVGNPARCISSCAAQSIGPNGNAGADGMASIIAHELEEAATDPNLNAWYDGRGQENADKCAWTFGSVSAAPNGAGYNMTLGSRQYLIQQNWVNSGNGFCAKSN